MPQPLEASEKDLAAETLGSDEDAEGEEDEIMVDAIEQQDPPSPDEDKITQAPEGKKKEVSVSVEVTKEEPIEPVESAKSESGEPEGSASSEASEASEGSEFKEDAEGEESEEEDTGQAKISEKSAKSDEEESESGESESASDNVSEERANENAVSSSSSSSEDEDEEESEKGSDSESSEAAVSSEEESEEEISKDKSDPNSCVYCKYGEHDGPKSEGGIQPYLTCSVCGDRAHQLCARANETVIDLDTWRCPSCVKNKLGTESGKLEDPKVSRPRGNSSRILKDLLPVARGVPKPGQHSVFAQLLLAEDDGNGPNLRKRKSPTGEPPPTMEKRRRKTTPKAATTPKSAAEVKAAGRRDSEDDLGDQVVVAQPTTTSSRPSRRVTQRQSDLIRSLQDTPKPRRDRTRTKLIVKLSIDTKKVKEILRKPPQPKPSRRRADRKLVVPPPGVQSHSQRFPCLPTRSLIFPSVPQDHRDLSLTSSNRPYSGTLDSKDASTKHTTSVSDIRDMFEGARQVAEEERRKASQALDKEPSSTPAPQQSRSNKRNANPASKIERIQFGKYVIDSFYAAPYPEEFSHETRLFVCEYCLKYLPSQFVAQRHKLKCPARHPPGDQIYVDGSVSVWEVDGRKKTEYCQCLCLMAKMFLGSKTLYYDVEPFLFYILTEADDDGYHFVGYFSKEKRPTSLNNVSCILVLPIHQRKGYATFLIDFSYLLTRIEGKEGSPEKPLSDMGLTAYRAYWDLTTSRHLLKLGMNAVSVKELMKFTGMTADDVVHTLERLYALVRDPVTGTYAIRYDKNLYEKLVEDDRRRGNVKLQDELLQWTPYVMGRSDVAHLESAPMQTVAPREGQEDEMMEDLEAPAPPSAIESEKPKVNGEGGDGQIQTKEFPMDIDQPTEEPPSTTDTQLINGLTNGIHQELPPPASPHQSSSPARPPDLSINTNGNLPHTNGDHRPPSSSPVPGPPSTANLDTALHNQPLLNGIYTTASNSSINHQHGNTTNHPVNEDPLHTTLDATHPESATSSSLSGYALAHHQSAIPPSRYQIVPPIPPSVLSAFNRSRRDRRRGNRRSALATPTTLGGLGIGGLNTPVRSSPRHTSGIAGLLTNRGKGGDGTGSVTSSLRRGRSGGLVEEKLVTGGEKEETEESEESDENESGSGSGSGSEEESGSESGSGDASENGSDEDGDSESGEGDEESDEAEAEVEAAEESSEAETEDEDEADDDLEKSKAAAAKEKIASASASGSEEEESEEDEEESEEEDAESKAKVDATADDDESSEGEDENENEASAKQGSSAEESSEGEDDDEGDDADAKEGSGSDEGDEEDEDEDADADVDGDKAMEAKADANTNPEATTEANTDADVDADADGVSDPPGAEADVDVDIDADGDPMDIDTANPEHPTTESTTTTVPAPSPAPVFVPTSDSAPTVVIPVMRKNSENP